MVGVANGTRHGRPQQVCDRFCPRHVNGRVESVAIGVARAVDKDLGDTQDVEAVVLVALEGGRGREREGEEEERRRGGEEVCRPSA